MNRNVAIGCVIAALVVMLLCIVLSIAGVLLVTPAFISDFSFVPSSTTEVVVAPSPSPDKAVASVPTLPSVKGDLPAEVRPQVSANGDFTALYEELGPGVVAIQSYVQQGGQVGAGSGSGFIIDDSGLIVTNEHVITDATRIEVVFFDGRTVLGTLLGSDVDSDLAVIQVDELPDSAHPLPLGDSDAVRPGQWVVAIGNPFGLQNTMTSGIVSAVGRMIPARIGSFSIPQAIQTDAAINPGNSGGPLLNMAGEVIGVNAQIRTDGTSAANAGVGFAIPVNIVRRVAPVLAQGDAYPWPWIGISGSAVSMLLVEAGDLSVDRGAYVAEVVQGSPADDAGLRGSRGVRDVNGISMPVGGDVIIAADGEPVLDFADLLETVAFSAAGDDIELTVLRDGEEIQVTVTLETRR